MASTPTLQWNFRFLVVCFAALAVSLPMAWVSLSKVALFITTLFCMATYRSQVRVSESRLPALTTRLILAILAAFAASLLWTEVELSFALDMLVKHAKLLQVVLLIFLIRNVGEAKLALKVFVCGQVFILVSSWLLAAGIPLPWVSNDQTARQTQNVVFSESYLDQSIMLATLAAVVWHLRAGWSRYAAALIATAALLAVMLLLPGRTGYVACFVVVLLAVLWSLPIRWRWALLLLGPLLVAVVLLAVGENRVTSRMAAVVQESQNYSQSGDTNSSSGWRLNAWRRSVQAIAIHPWTGYGVGSWTPAVKRLDGANAEANFGIGNSSNPHQEYLLWGVELGVVGSLLLVALLVSMALDARKYPAGVQRATHSAIAVIAVSCLFNSTLYDALIGDYLCTAVGLLMALGMHSSVEGTGKLS